jgi:predicted DNA binding protein
MPIIAKVYFSHPEMALADVITSGPDVTIRVLQEVSTDPVGGSSFFAVETDQPELLERTLAADHTVKRAERVSQYQEWPVYRVEFNPEALLLGSVVTEQDGFALDAQQHDGGWIERWQLPDRQALQAVWQYAEEHSFTFDIMKVSQVSNTGDVGMFGLTDKQRTTLVAAYDNGYFTEPSETTLSEIAADLDISTNAASGRLKRGMKNIIESSFPEIDQR